MLPLSRRVLAFASLALLLMVALPLASAAPGHEPSCDRPPAYIPNNWILADGHIHYRGCWDIVGESPWWDSDPYWDGEDWFSSSDCGSGLALAEEFGYYGLLYSSCDTPSTHGSRLLVRPDASSEGVRVRGYAMQGVPNLDIIAVGVDACVSLTDGETGPCGGSGDLWNAKFAAYRVNWGYIYDPLWGVWRHGPTALVVELDQDSMPDEEPNADPSRAFNVSVDGIGATDLVPNRVTTGFDGAVHVGHHYEPDEPSECVLPRVRTSTNVDTPCVRPHIDGSG